MSLNLRGFRKIYFLVKKNTISQEKEIKDIKILKKEKLYYLQAIQLLTWKAKDNQTEINYKHYEGAFPGDPVV